MYRHILIATDGSELADKGVTQGANLANELGAKVTLVTVTEEWSPVAMAQQVERGVQNALEIFEQAAAKEAAAVLDHASVTVDGQGVPFETLHIAGQHPAEGILEAAKDVGCDLIVMASHGRRGIRRVLLGSQAAEVLAHTHVPVLIIR